MKISLILILAAALCTPLFAQKHRVVVERPTPAPDTTVIPTEPGPRRMVIDPSELIYQMQVDSINQVTEDKVRDLIGRLERKFEDPKVEEEVGRLIGEVVMQQQMALLDLQIDRAISIRDTLLLRGLEFALQQLLANSDVVRDEIRKQLESLERQMTEENAEPLKR